MEVEKKKGRRVCVTGAGGYIASWLVKLLLSKGYEVHGTVRDPSDEKNAHLRKMDMASENLQMFKVDLHDSTSLLAAIDGCEGVFHVAGPVPSAQMTDPEAEIKAPTVTGTMNVLKACSAVGVKRVIMVSSIVAVMWNPHWPKDKPMDETSWTDTEHLQTCKLPSMQNWYFVSKTMAEAEALEYAKKHNELAVVTLCPSLVLGPLLQPTVNVTNLLFIGVMQGISTEPMVDTTHYIVDVRDVADALLLLYEKEGTSGRYICANNEIRISNLVGMLKSMFPNYNYPNCFTEAIVEYSLSSEKLKMLGWSGRPLKETLVDAVECFQEAGILEV